MDNSLELSALENHEAFLYLKSKEASPSHSVISNNSAIPVSDQIKPPKKKYKTDTRLNIEHERLKTLKEYVSLQKAERGIYKAKYEAELEYLKQRHAIEKEVQASKQAMIEQHRNEMNEKLERLNKTLQDFSSNICGVLKQNMDVQKQVLDLLKNDIGTTSGHQTVQYHHHQ